MILPAYTIADSAIPGAGRGLFLSAAMRRGSVLVAPAGVPDARVLPRARLAELPADGVEAASALRWFEDRHTIDPDWSDECYINHSFAPSGLWLLGFVFATRDLVAGDELTIDYSLLLDEDQELPFPDAVTGRRIRGLPWRECLRRGASGVLGLCE